MKWPTIEEIDEAVHEGRGMKWPTIEEIDEASAEQIRVWVRDLPSPSNPAEADAMQHLMCLFFENGCFNPDL